ncbi:MAG: serine protein kinase RIO [Nitrososphaeraceae archaeon]
MFEEIEDNETAQQQKIMDRVDRRLYRHEHENRFLLKRSEDYSVFDDVFNAPTLMVINDLINHNVLGYIKGPLASGKESKVYLAVDKDRQHFLSVKIYLTVSAEFRKRLQYIAGDPRFSATKKGSRNLISSWAKKEFKNLRTAYENGLSVPAPYKVRQNVLVMEFIGDDAGIPCPILLNSNSVISEDYREIIEQMSKLYQKAKLVHADLSEYNIFKCTNGRIVLFDFGSSVNIKQPNSGQFLKRDITNINRFFRERGVKVLDGELAIRKITGENK